MKAEKARTGRAPAAAGSRSAVSSAAVAGADTRMDRSGYLADLHVSHSRGFVLAAASSVGGSAR